MPAETLRAETTIELGIPDRYVGAIFGVQGAKIMEIQELSGAAVDVSKRYGALIYVCVYDGLG